MGMRLKKGRRRIEQDLFSGLGRPDGLETNRQRGANGRGEGERTRTGREKKIGRKEREKERKRKERKEKKVRRNRKFSIFEKFPREKFSNDGELTFACINFSLRTLYKMYFQI